MLGGGEGAVRIGFDNWITDVREVGNSLPIHLAISAGALRAALHNMPGDCASRELIEFILLPTEAVDHGSERKGGVGGAAGDYDIGAGGQRFGQRKSPDVGVGAQNAISN